MTEKIDVSSLKTWIGNSETVSDYLTSSLVDRFHATLDPLLWLGGDGAPLGIQWCTNVPAAHTGKLSEDGHALKGVFCRLCRFLPECGLGVRSSTTRNFLQICR